MVLFVGGASFSMIHSVFLANLWRILAKSSCSWGDGVLIFDQVVRSTC